MAESLGDAVLDLRANLIPLKRDLAAANATTLSSIKATATKSKAAMAGVFAAGAVVIGAGLNKVASEFDAAFDEIRAGTGATGKALEGLKDDFREVFRTVPDDAKTVGKAVADLNTRLGLTGEPLQNLTRQILQLSRVTDTDLNENIESVTRVLGDWSVKTEHQERKLDGLFRVSQATGISVSKLSRDLVQFGSPLRQLGFDIETAAAMFARFEREGVNAQTLMPGFKQAVSNLARPTSTLTDRLDSLGISLEGTFEEQLAAVFESLEGMKDETEAAALAADIFGTRAGPDMAAAIQEGRFELDELIGVMKNGEDTIGAVADETFDWQEKLKILRNRGLLAVEKPAQVVFDLLNLLADGAIVTTEAFSALPGPIKAVALGLGLLAIAARINPWVAIVTATIALVGIISRNWDTIMAVVDDALDWLSNAFRDVRDFLIGVWRAIWGGVKWAIDKILGGYSTILNAAADMVDKLSGIPLIGDKFKGMAEGIRDGADSIDELRESLRDEDEQRKHVERGIDSLEKLTRTKMGQMAGVTERRVGQIRDALAEGTKQGRDAVRREFDRIVRDVEKAMKRGEIGVRKGNRLINAALREGLASVGISGSDAEKIIRATRRPEDVRGLRSGGDVEIPGVGTGDKVPVTVGGVPVALTEPGERMFILNRNANSMLDQLVALNGAVPRREGGYVDLWGTGLARLQGGGFAELQPAARALANQLGSRGFTPTSTYRSTSTTFHGSGEAIDYGDSVNNLRALWPLLRGQVARLAELFGPSYLPGATLWKFGSPFSSSDLQSTHEDHIHVAITEMIRALAARIKLPRFTGRFAQGVAGAKGLNNIARELEARVNAGVPGHGPGDAAQAGSMSKAQIAALWRQANGGLGDPNLMAAIALAESSGNPSAHGPPDGRGLWQIEWPIWSSALGHLGNPYNPLANAKMAGEVLRRQGLGAWVVYNTGAYQKFMRSGGQLDFSQLASLPFLGSAHKGMTATREGLVHTLPGEHTGFPVSPQVNVNVANGMEWLRDFITIEIDDATPEIIERGFREGGRHRAQSRALRGRD